MPKPRIEVKGNNPPTFSVPQNPLVILQVCCARDLEPYDEDNYLWKIERGTDEKTELPQEIVYGIVPNGWKQSIPKNGEKPLPLDNGRKYSCFGFVRSGYAGYSGCFKISDGKVLDADCSHPNLKIEADIKEGVELPQFNIKGDDYLFEVLISHEEDAPEKELGDRIMIYSWQIRPSNEYKRKLPIEIVYGNLPKGYKQLEPEGLATPEKLKSGIKYSYDIRGVYGGASGCFEIVNGKVCKVDCYYTEHCKK